ncbi:BppU family phage baseplate upper protein [Mammaliicoccus sciuri]|uniref:BppU family phage baseplate upper protein n=1 Tax=Mammaliicoccus sciuri TaxID=1296 RepID=UPI001F0F8DA9|nr:BppU family phage baseplate upper protein [Mammaliicoccus sciuri]MCH5141585.1 BppU family phage baseplate upper protein [Mammaliicoccus sciuri]
MVQKYGDIKLETSAEYKAPIKTNISFDDTDVGSAVLRFFLTYGNQPLLLDEATTELSIFLVAHDGYFEKHNLNYDDPLNGKVSVKLTDTFLAHSGLAKGQIYIKVIGENSVITQVKFTFNIEDSLINDIPADVQMKEIRIFAELEAEINNMVNNINEKLSDGQAVVDEMNALINQAKLDLQLTVNTAKDEFEVIKTTFSNDVQTSTDNAKTEIETAKNSAVSDINALNQSNTTNWQKHKVTGDDGFTRMITSPDLSVTTLDNYFTKTEKVYVTTPVNSPNGNGFSGFINATFRSGGYGIITFQPYNSNLIYMTRRVNSPTWTSWELFEPSANKNKRISLGNITTSILQLAPGLYEGTIPAQANTVNAPFDKDLASYIAEIDVFEGANGRKQIRLRHNYRNLEYITTIHTNNQFTGWKKIVTEEYGKQQNADTGWIQWQLENGAVNRNETTGEGTLYRNEYRVITTNGITRAHIRFNISNITPNAIVGRIPAKMVTKAQTGLLRSGLSRNPVVYTINIDGSIKLMVHSNDIGNWDTASYCIGEQSWIVDGEFFDNIDTGGTSGLEGESADDLVDEDIVENPDDDPDYDDPSAGDPTTDEEPSDEEIIEDGEEDLPDYGDALDELDEDLESDNNG